MSAEILRRAAALMRERAEAVPDGPWEKEFSDVVRTDAPFGGPDYLIAETPTVERATHIASWHPTVALAVADSLESVADEPWCCDDCKYAPDNPNAIVQRALAVSRAYLGDQP